MFALFSLVTLLPPVASDDAVALPSRIEAVTVYTDSASVERVAEVPAGGGRFVLRDLPSVLDQEAVRVRCDGAEVVSVEPRGRYVAAAPDERIAQLRAEIEGLRGEMSLVDDQLEVLGRLQAHANTLLALEERAFTAGLTGGASADPEAGARLDWIGERLVALDADSREVSTRRADVERRLADASAQLGELVEGAGTSVVDLYVELVDTTGRAATVTAEYLVSGAGWTPVYDLRTPRNLSHVELVYRAAVRQQTGEDWKDAALALSTAQPRRGAKGPELQQRWLSLGAPVAVDRDFVAYRKAEVRLEATAGLSFFDTAALTAQVADTGLSVRYLIPRRETVESRDEATTVLIGRADLDVRPEHVVVPELDETVWLRGRTTNRSEWVLLPGRAAVYFGNDFLGHAAIPTVQRGEELVLHLGADPGLSVERLLLKEETEGSGIFSSTETLRTKLRFRIRNSGGLSTAPDGGVTVTLHEAVPRSDDERVEVEIARAKPDPARSERFDLLREERGVETWTLRVPRGDERVIELETEIRYPEDLTLRRR